MRVCNKFAKLYGGQCPCCGVTMLEDGERPLAPEEQGLRRTQAHTYPRKHPHRQGQDWFWACQQCNTDQGHLSLDEWWLVLLNRGDERHHRVRALLQGLNGRGGLCPGSVRSFFARIEQHALEPRQ